LSAEAANPVTFSLDIGGQYAGTYDECRGLGSSNDVEEAVIETPGGVTVRQKTAGALEWHNITLKRSEPSGVTVWSWRKAMEDGDVNDAIRDGAITLWRTGSLGEPLARWEFRNGWVAALSFDGSIEEMTIVHEGLERTDIVPHGKPPRPNP
jgi:phage tail-like protein